MREQILLNHPPHSKEIGEAKVALGMYVNLKSATVNQAILVPKEKDVLLKLKETDKYTIKTNISLLEQWLNLLINKLPERNHSYQELLEKVHANEIEFIQYLLDQDGYYQAIDKTESVPFFQRLKARLSKPLDKTSSKAESLGSYISTAKGFQLRAIKDFMFYLWDKEEKHYASHVEYYEIINHIGPAMGSNKDYICYKGTEIMSWNTILY